MVRKQETSSNASEKSRTTRAERKKDPVVTAGVERGALAEPPEPPRFENVNDADMESNPPTPREAPEDLPIPGSDSDDLNEVKARKREACLDDVPLQIKKTRY